MPSPKGKNPYVGIEIECFGKTDRIKLRSLLNEDTKLRGKFDVVGDPSIRPSPEPLVKGALRLKSASIIKVPVKITTGTLKSGYLSYSVRETITEIKGKQGVYYKRSVVPFFYEEMYNGTKWVKVKGVKYLPDTNYLQGKSYSSKKDYWYYHNKKDYYDPRSQNVRGLEVRLLVKQKEAHHIIKRVYDVLNANGIRVNNSCGLHVHLDMRHRDKDVVYKNLFLCQELFFKVHKARKSSRWCRKNTGNTYTRQRNSGGRYWCVNPNSYDRHKTLEVRVGEATMDHERVIAWVRMLCNIADRKSAMKEPIKTFTQYLKKFTLTDVQTKKIKEMQTKRAAA